MNESNIIKRTYQLGQSIWLDFIDRKLIESGELKKFIDEDGLRGMTSNPAIFEKAISSGDQYTQQIRQLSGGGGAGNGTGGAGDGSGNKAEDGGGGTGDGSGGKTGNQAADKAGDKPSDKTNEEIFYSLALDDIKAAADLFKSVYEEKVKGADGYVSLEVSPRLARDTTATVNQAISLWGRAARQNVMIKVPGTIEGLPAIRHLIGEGLNINVTLLFGLERYQQVIEAFVSGLEDRIRAGKSVDGIASVASFFLSRIDVLLDPVLKEKGLQDLNGKAAIALAKKAYQLYKKAFSSDRWKTLADKGARPQRLLWASTSSKDPSFPDTKYVDALIGKDTVDTVPMETYHAFRDHGHVAETLESDLPAADQVLDTLSKNGIDMNAVAQRLENEGIDKFVQPYDKLLKAIEGKRREEAGIGTKAG
jgi:transaldolase